MYTHQARQNMVTRKLLTQPSNEDLGRLNSILAIITKAMIGGFYDPKLSPNPNEDFGRQNKTVQSVAQNDDSHP